MVYPTTL
jgi:Niemann-Pick C1 protein